MLIFVNTPLNEVNKKRLQAKLPQDYEVVFKNDLPLSQQQEYFKRAEIVLGNPSPAWVNGPLNLQWWQLDSAGFEYYKGLPISIPITNMGDYFAWPCAETIVSGILAFYRHIPELVVLQTKKKWVGVPIRFTLGLLRRKKVVILGTGGIGSSVRKMLSGFDCDIKMLARKDPQAQLHSAEELKEVLPDTDLVINCLPGTAKGFFSAELIAAMKPDSVFANVGRGSTVDEEALIIALQEGRIGGAVLDVNEVEPLPVDSPLWEMPNVILTQHTGGGQLTEDEGKVDLFISNLEKFRRGEPLENPIDLSQGY
jgi:phosphoglycerate dehydrogenase-like enzyme